MARVSRTPETGGKVHGLRETKTRPRARIMGAPAEAVGTHENQERQPKTGPKSANVLPKSLHWEIARVHRLALAAGLFMEDRDLLHCANCGLLEDVGCYGLLMAYFSGKPPVDSGLRFTKDKRRRYICPNCGTVARTPRKNRR